MAARRDDRRRQQPIGAAPGDGAGDGARVAAQDLDASLAPVAGLPFGVVAEATGPAGRRDRAGDADLAACREQDAAAGAAPAAAVVARGVPGAVRAVGAQESG